MATQFFGQRIKRNEDPRLLTGQALFVDDVDLPNMGHVAFVRSPHAHARILEIDADDAKELPGVIGVWTADDLGDYWQNGAAACATSTGRRDDVQRADPSQSCQRQSALRG